VSAESVRALEYVSVAINSVAESIGKMAEAMAGGGEGVVAQQPFPIMEYHSAKVMRAAVHELMNVLQCASVGAPCADVYWQECGCSICQAYTVGVEALEVGDK
jgi:hypothetical protein